MKKQSGNNKKIAFLAIFGLIIVLFIAGYLVKDRQGGNKIIASGDQAPEFRLQTPGRRFISLSDLRGKVVMVHFWATWCPPCVEEIPTLDKLYSSLMGKDFEMLAISVDEGGVEAVVPFVQKNRLNVPMLLDPGHRIASLYGTFKFPETYIVDRQGKVRYKAIGPRDWSDPSNVQLLRDIIAAQ